MEGNFNFGGGGFNDFGNKYNQPASVPGGQPFGGFKPPRSNPSIEYINVGGSSGGGGRNDMQDKIDRDIREHAEYVERINQGLNVPNKPASNEYYHANYPVPLVYNSIGLPREYNANEVLGAFGYTSGSCNGHNENVSKIIKFAVNSFNGCWGSNGIDHGDAGAGLNDTFRTKAINIGGCNVTDNDMANLFCTLRDYNFNLDVINLRGNNFGDKGVESLMYGVTQMNFQTGYRPHDHPQPYTQYKMDIMTVQKVQYFNLSDNINIGDNSAKVIGDNLAKLPDTKLFNLSGTSVTPVGESILVKAMQDENVQHMIIKTQKLQFNAKFFIGTREEKIAISKQLIQEAREKGVGNDSVVVESSWWNKIKNQLAFNESIFVDGVGGFIKCKWNPKDIPVGYAQGEIIAHLPKGKFINKLVDVESWVSCLLGASEDVYSTESGIKMLKHELCVMGETEFCNE